MPASLAEIGARLKGEIPGHPDRRIEARTILDALRVPLDPDRRAFTDFRTSAQFTLVPYVPQALGIAVARAFGSPVLGLLYAARLANLLAATALIVIGLRRLPSYSWLTALLALTPMALFLRASASADALTFGLAVLLVGTAARLAWGEEKERCWKDVAVLAASAAGLCLSKPVYVTLGLLVLLIPANRLPGRRPGRRWSPAVALVLAVMAASFVVAMATASAVDISIRPGWPVAREQQIRDAVAEPLRVAGILGADYLERGDRYAAQMVGQLGWLDTNLPKPFLWGYLLLLGGLVLVDTRRRPEGVLVTPGQRLLLTLLALATLALVSASQYAAFTPYRADFVDGIQGRYFLPLAPAAAWILHSRRFAVDPRLPGRALPWISALSSAFALWIVAVRYYGL